MRFRTVPNPLMRFTIKPSGLMGDITSLYIHTSQSTTMLEMSEQELLDLSMEIDKFLNKKAKVS